MKYPIIFTVLMLTFGIAAAQIPHTISYQGYYTSNGQPFTGTYPMTFRLDTLQTGGGSIWSQGPQSVQITKGVYNVVLNVSNVAFDRQYWLETVINGNTSTPRTQLTGVPYSLAPWNPRDSNVYFSGGNVGIGTTTPDHHLSVIGGPVWTSNGWAGALELSNGSAIGWQTNAGGQRFGIGHSGDGLYMFRTASDPGTNGSPATYDMVINDAGNVGIGTTNPFAKLQVAGNVYLTGPVVGSLGMEVGRSGELNVDNGVQGGEDVVGGRFKVAQNGNVGIGKPSPGYKLDVGGAINATALYTSGNVGIGTTNPAEKLHVAGDFILVDGAGNEQVYIGGDGAGGDVQLGSMNPNVGNVALWNTATGKLMNLGVAVLSIAGGSDVAEPFETAQSTELEPGTVMVIDNDNPGKLKMSEHTYDSKVAGIVSGAGGVKPGITLQQHGVMEGNSLIAIAGRVYCKAEALSAPIEPGDLLTTSDITGYAMKAADVGRSHGAVIGKAMSSLKSGKGLVLVLVNLQ